MSAWYHTSPSVIARMCLPPLQKRKLPQATLAPFLTPPSRRAADRPPAFVLYDKTSHAAEIARLTSGTTLILVPEASLIPEVQALLPPDEGNTYMTWHSQLSVKEQFERWLKVRNGEATVVVGTRSAIFLPFPELSAILIDYEHKENHKHWDQTPRFHIKDVAAEIGRLFGAVQYHLSYIPSSDTYYNIHKRGIVGSTNIPKYVLPCIVDMREERRGGNYSLFAARVSAAIASAREDVFLFIQRRGFASSVGCRDCGYVARCATCTQAYTYHDADRTLRCHYCRSTLPLFATCPTCGSTLVTLHGAGTELAEKTVRSILEGKNTHDVIRIDGEEPAAPPVEGRPRFLIGTEMAFPIVRWAATETIIFIDIDKQLALPEFRSSEHVWQLIHEALFRKKKDAAFYVQTHAPDHIVLRSLREPDRFYRTDLQARKLVGLPPYSYIARYLVGHKSRERAKLSAETFFHKMSNILTNEAKPLTLEGPFETQPPFYRNVFWYTILAKFDPVGWPDDLAWLNHHVPPEWKVDPNPLSLLQP